MRQKVKYKRVLLKFSGEFLGDEKGQGLHISSIMKIIEEIKPIIKSGIRIGIVLGAGNIFRGAVLRQKEKFSRTFNQTEADKAGMMATIINSILFSDMLSQMNIKNQVFSTIFIDSLPFFDAKKASAYLDSGYLNIYAGGTSNPFVTTDTAAVLKAVETGSNVLIKATKVAGIYDKDPVKYKDAKFFKKISYLEIIDKRLKIMDLTAISLAMDNKLPIAVLDFYKKGNLFDLIIGKNVGTLVSS